MYISLAIATAARRVRTMGAYGQGASSVPVQSLRQRASQVDGKCPDCGTWDALEEYKAPAEDARRPLRVGGKSGDVMQAAEAVSSEAESWEPRSSWWAGPKT